MASEESLKRKNSETESESLGECSSEPEIKIQKIDVESLEPNLKTGDEEDNNYIRTSLDSNITNDSGEEKETNVDETEQPFPTHSCNISIKFHDHSTVDKYRAKFLKFLESFIEFQITCEDDHSFTVQVDDSINGDEWVIVGETETASHSKFIKTTAVTKTIETQSGDDVLVLEESHTSINDEILEESTLTPSKKRKKRSKTKKALFVVDATPSPIAAQADLRYTTKFKISSEKTEENSAAQFSKQSLFNTCFNCDQAHSLKDCPLPKNQARINVARNKFHQQSKTSRYHLEEEQKYSHLSPGKLSSELRKALGLHKNEAPHFIYLMRKLGYPPGWLEEAKVEHSNLEMFDIDGNFVKTTSTKKTGLDPTKIVDYPGFNVPFEKGIKDDYRRYGVPPYSNDFSKDAMINFFNQKFAQEEDNLETCDMDIDHEQESSSQEKEVEPVKDEGSEENRKSPSLLDLEQQKQQLLDELKDETKEEKLEKDFLAVKTTHFGTPILKSHSPYSTLPDPDKFSKDVSPVINFENLPNSTGKYEQMTDVLQKVRNTLKKIHST